VVPGRRRSNGDKTCPSHKTYYCVQVCYPACITVHVCPLKWAAYHSRTRRPYSSRDELIAPCPGLEPSAPACQRLMQARLERLLRATGSASNCTLCTEYSVSVIHEMDVSPFPPEESPASVLPYPSRATSERLTSLPCHGRSLSIRLLVLVVYMPSSRKCSCYVYLSGLYGLQIPFD
jgi:hypothetical protein